MKRISLIGFVPPLPTIEEMRKNQEKSEAQRKAKARARRLRKRFTLSEWQTILNQRT
jgi:hypothetical protein